jgi:hypothetical protein
MTMEEDFTMRQESEFAILIAALIVVGIFAAPAARAQNAAPPSLKEQLEAQYTLSKVHSDGTVEAGTVLIVQQVGIKGGPQSDLAMAPAVYKDGVLHPPSKGSAFGASLLQAMNQPGSDTSGKDFRPFPVGDKVYVSKLDVNTKKDKITFVTVECGACNGVDQASAYKAAVSFQFAKGYLATASVPDVEDTIAKVFAIDTGAAQAQPAQPGVQPEQPAAAQQAPAQAPAPAQIQLGQTIDQVVAVLGQPEKIVDLGSKKIYVYKDLKVTFVNGKVSDVQ